MIELEWDVPERLPQVKAMLERVVSACCRAEGIGDVLMHIRIVSDAIIWQVNLEERNIDKPTDVLSFPTVNYPACSTAKDCPNRLRREYDPESGLPFVGDCLISLETARRQAAEFGHSLSREIGYLACHSAFHLMGYDHMNYSDKARMRAMEESAMGLAGIERDAKEDFVMTDKRLFEMACEAILNSYSPYSNFAVGACLLTSDGRIFAGVNIENASYGATICAERSAVSAAVTQGATEFEAIAIAANDAYPWPCGICRQVLSEFSPDMRVICGPVGGEFKEAKLSELLKNVFTKEALK